MKFINGIIVESMRKKVRLSNWVTANAKEHLSKKAKEKSLSESVILEIQIMKLK